MLYLIWIVSIVIAVGIPVYIEIRCESSSKQKG